MKQHRETPEITLGRVEALRQAIIDATPGYEERLAAYAAEIGIPSALKWQDALATSICREGYKRPENSGHVDAYLRRKTVEIVSGGDDLQPLAVAVRLRTDAVGEDDAATGVAERGIPVVVDGDGCRLALRERLEVDIGNLRKYISADAYTVLTARMEGVPYARMGNYLWGITHERWSSRRVGRAKRELARKAKSGLISVGTTYHDGLSPCTQGLERLSSGRLVWTHLPPDPALRDIIVSNLPVRGC